MQKTLFKWHSIPSWCVTCLLLLSSLSVYSQIILPAPTAEWNLIKTGGDPFGDPCWGNENFRITVGADSIIGANVYSLLSMERTYSYTQNIVTDQICYSDTIDLNYGIIGALRHDSMKTFFLELNNGLSPILGDGIPDTTELLLYDFSGSVGDIIPIIKSDGDLTYDSITVVDWITLGDGILRKVIQVQNSLSGIHDYYEGIGDIYYGLFGPLQYIPFEQFLNLNCYREADIYLLGTDQCDLTDPVVNIHQTDPPDQIKVWPNPVSSQLNYMTRSAEIAFTLYASDGNKVYQSASHQTYGSLNLTHLPAGIYALDICTENGQHTQIKICKI